MGYKLRKPVFGNSFTINQNSNNKRTLDGTLIINNGVNDLLPNAGFPVFQGFKMTIKALKKSDRDYLITFFQGAAGQEIIFTDHENKQWKGFINSDPELTTEGNDNNCRYVLNFGFEGIKI